jgi:hypothetical protein
MKRTYQVDYGNVQFKATGRKAKLVMESEPVENGYGVFATFETGSKIRLQKLFASETGAEECIKRIGEICKDHSFPRINSKGQDQWIKTGIDL